MWKSTSGSIGSHYSVMSLKGSGMDALRAMFPGGKADEMNAVLFSTSGIHGTCNTIEEVEDTLLNRADEGYECSDVTFLVLQPRIVCLRYGNCEPKNADDIAFLKRLRSSSHKALAGIGAATIPLKE